MIDPHGRVMMISGANRGIGAALARRFHAEGWLVSLGARNLDQLQSSVQEWADDNVSCHHYDAFDPDTDQAWIASTVAAHGRIDGLLSGQLNLNRNDNDRIALTITCLPRPWNLRTSLSAASFASAPEF